MRLGVGFKKDRNNATLIQIDIWQKQLDTCWADYVRMHEAVMARAGVQEIDEQEKIYDMANNYYFQMCELISELREEQSQNVTNQDDDLSCKYSVLCHRLKSACKRAEENAANMSVNQIELLNKTIIDLFIEIQEVDMKRIMNGNDQEEILNAEDELRAVHDAAIDKLLDARQLFDAPAGQINAACDADLLKIPQLQITPFDGRLDKWEAFRESFTHGIHERRNLPAIQKLQYLKSVLRGAPEELIQNFSLTNDNYATAWKLLNDRYDNKQELVVSHLRVIISLPQCRQSADDLRRVTNATASSLLALKNLGRPVAQWDDWVVLHVCEKIDQESRRMWRQHRANCEELATWDELDKFLQGRIRALTTDVDTSAAKIGNRASSSKVGNGPKIHAHQATTMSKRDQQSASTLGDTQQVCHCCTGTHLITWCPEFVKMSIPDRRTLASAKSLCYMCLAKGHHSQQCKKQQLCHKCGLKHNTMLHPDNQTSSSTDQTVQAHVVTSSSEAHRPRPLVLLTTAIVNVCDAGGEKHEMRAFIDNGSESSFISEYAAQSLRLPRQSECKELGAIAGVNAGHISQSVWLTVSDRHGHGYEVNVNALILRRVTDSFKAMPVPEGHRWPHINGLLLADPEFMKRRRVDILLGGDVFGECLIPNIRQYPGLPTAMNSHFGWLLNGKVPEENYGHRVENTVIQTYHISIDQQLERFWEMEETEAVRRLTVDEEKCESHYETTFTREANGRMCVRIPLKHSEVDFGESQRFAVQRQLQIERRFKTNPEFANQYRAFMAQYLELGHMREVVGAPVDLTRSYKMQDNNRRHYYIPHHAVMKESSSTTKLRVVFDASRRSTNGASLNDQMLIGPRLQDDLTAIMMRWRQYRVAYCADIEKMYRQISVNDADVDLQRIVWRPTTDEQMKVFQLTTVTYGTASAPYLAIKSMQTLANLESERFPIGAKIVESNFYVDDVLSGADSEPECIRAQGELIALLDSGGLSLRKWASNSENVLAQVIPAHRECQLPLSIEDESSISTLGIQWHPAADVIGFKINLDSDSARWTKRSFLSAASRLYDPLGWVGPCIIVVKIMFQEMWKLNLDWDDELPVDLANRWNQIRISLHLLRDLRINRWIGTMCTSTIEVHGFCDASMSAFAAVVYVKVTTADNQTTISNICAKTRVAPVKVVSLPRLELCGAVLLVKLIGDVTRAMHWPNAKVYCWTDSTIVLSWLRGHPSQYNVFVANRTAEIQRKYPVEHWQHVASGDNPADCASRGISAEQLMSHQLWWTGPVWLRDSSSAWPSQPTLNATTEENRVRVHTTTVHSPCADMLATYSNLTRLVRVTAWCARFVFNCRHPKEERRISILTSAELIGARDEWVRAAQAVAYDEELRRMRKNLPISKSSVLKALNPVYSTDQILRVGGRLANAHAISAAARSPAIIPRRCKLSTLIISDAHEKTLHGGPTLMLAYIRRAYWIVDGPNEVRRYVKRCTICFRYAAKPTHQLMAALPAARVVPSRPFKHSAMDYSGAIMVRSAKGRGRHATKAYVAVFVCLATKAVHIEVASDLTTAGFIAAYERFVARRGCCSDLYSDNATNFVGASAVFMRSERSQFDNRVLDALATKGTTWHFSPPLSPHFNGLAESAIRSVKHHIRRVVGESTLTFEELTTVLAKIEACLNSRPICPMSSDPGDLDVLTPGHFLVGEPLTIIPQNDLLQHNCSTLTRWQLTHQMVQRFWKRWSSEYLHTLQQRNKWQTTKENVKINDMVLVIEDNLPPAKWSIGRVIDVHPGNDGNVRVVSVRTKGSTFKRSVVKVAKLPLEKVDDNTV